MAETIEQKESQIVPIASIRRDWSCKQGYRSIPSLLCRRAWVYLGNRKVAPGFTPNPSTDGRVPAACYLATAQNLLALIYADLPPPRT